MNQSFECNEVETTAAATPPTQEVSTSLAPTKETAPFTTAEFDFFNENKARTSQAIVGRHDPSTHRPIVVLQSAMGPNYCQAGEITKLAAKIHPNKLIVLMKSTGVPL